MWKKGPKAHAGDPPEDISELSWPYRGRITWTSPERRGRHSGPPSTQGQYFATAFVVKELISEGPASFVLAEFESGAWESKAVGRWLMPERAELQGLIGPGATVAICEGPQVVCYFVVNEVLS